MSLLTKALQDVVLVQSKAGYSLERTINSSPMTSMVMELGTFVLENFIRPCLDLKMRPQENMGRHYTSVLLSRQYDWNRLYMRYSDLSTKLNK